MYSRSKFRDRRIFHKYESLTDPQFKKNFKVCRETFERLYLDLEDTIPEGRSHNGKNLLKKEKLLSFLKFAGSNNFLSDACEWLEIGEGTLFNCIGKEIFTLLCLKS